MGAQFEALDEHCRWADGTRHSLMVDFLDVFNHTTSPADISNVIEGVIDIDFLEVLTLN